MHGNLLPGIAASAYRAAGFVVDWKPLGVSSGNGCRQALNSVNQPSRLYKGWGWLLIPRENEPKSEILRSHLPNNALEEIEQLDAGSGRGTGR